MAMKKILAIALMAVVAILLTCTLIKNYNENRVKELKELEKEIKSLETQLEWLKKGPLAFIK